MRKYNEDLFNTQIVGATSSRIINMENVESWSIQNKYDVNTPSALSFATTDVNVTGNTITEATHGFTTGLKGQFTTTGGLPAGLSLATDYFIIVVDVNTYKVATSLANALIGTAVDITTQGTGTHTFTPTAIAGGTIKAYKSNDQTNWTEITGALPEATSITVSADGETWWHEPITTTAKSNSISYAFLKVIATCTAGRYLLNSYLNVEAKK